MLEYVPYVALGFSLLALGVCFIIQGSIKKTKKMIEEEIALRGKQDDKLYLIIDSRFKAAMMPKEPEKNVFFKPPVQQYPNGFDELLQSQNREEPNYGQRNI